MKREKRTLNRIHIHLLAVICLIVLFLAVPCQAEPIQAASNPKLSKKSVRLIKGETIKLKLKGAKGKVTWKSTKKAIASVNKKGIVKARKKGNAKIVARYAGKSYKCKVWVETPQISKTSIVLEVGQTDTLAIQGTKQRVTWSSVYPQIADVDANGKITANSVGTTVISATIGKNSYSCIVTVKDKSQDITETKPQPEPEPQSQPDPQPEPQPDSQPSGEVKMGIYNNSVDTLEECTNVITTEENDIGELIVNDTKSDIIVCRGSVIEQKIEGEWVRIWGEIEVDEGDKYLAPGEKYRNCVYMNNYLDVGEYRLTKKIKIGDEIRDLIQEFTCEQGVLLVSITPVGSCTVPKGQETFDVRVKNYSNMTVSVFSPCILEKKVDEQWIEWDLGWVDISSSPAILPGDEDIIGAFLIPGYPEYPLSNTCEPGEYRIKTWCEAGRQMKICYVAFEIVE
ncbi:MAG: Ig-like domain-containing protein [Lachnospiraceae bacterium]|nr:Ig-like domain-containing protein [Lachnospiraceae bacterium]